MPGEVQLIGFKPSFAIFPQFNFNVALEFQFTQQKKKVCTRVGKYSE